MAKLYIRFKDDLWINFINSKQDLLDFEAMLIPGRSLVIGDVSTFTPTMRLMLLKLIEENPTLDCYSSTDLADPILLSRFSLIVKQPIFLQSGHSPESWAEAKHDYANAVQFQGTSPIDVQLRLPIVNKHSEKLLQLL